MAVNQIKKRPVQASPTITDIAAVVGVAPSTVSLGLRGDPRVTQGKRDLIRMVAKQMNYRPSATARALSSRRTRTIGVVFSKEWSVSADLLFSSYSHTIQSISRVLAHEHYHMAMVTGSSFDDGDAPRHAARMFQEAVVDGLLVIHDPNNALLSAIRGLGVPWVLIDGKQAEGVATATTDESAAAVQAVEHLAQLGHRCIANLASCVSSQTHRSEQFVQGYLRATGSAGLVPVTNWGEYDEELAYLKALWEKPEKPTALITYDDRSALRAIHWLSQQGVSVPAQVSVVALHDTGYADPVGVPLLPRVTCKACMQEKMAKLAMEKLFAQLHNPDQTVESTLIQPRLMIRETTAPCVRSA